MKVYSLLLLLLALFEGCSSRETPPTDKQADLIQTPVTVAEPQQPDNQASEPDIELEAEAQEKLALQQLDSLELAMAENDSIQPSVRILTERLLDAIAPLGTDTLLVTMLKSNPYPFVSYGGYGEGEVFTYRLSVFKKEKSDLTLISHDDFEQGGGYIKTESSFSLIEVAKGRYAVSVLSRREGFNGTGTTDYSTINLYALNEKKLVSIFSIMASELFEGSTDNETPERTEIRSFRMLQSITNGLFDIDVSEQKNRNSNTSTEQTYTWSGEKYIIR